MRIAEDIDALTRAAEVRSSKLLIRYNEASAAFRKRRSTAAERYIEKGSGTLCTSACYRRVGHFRIQVIQELGELKWRPRPIGRYFVCGGDKDHCID